MARGVMKNKPLKVCIFRVLLLPTWKCADGYQKAGSTYTFVFTTLSHRCQVTLMMQLQSDTADVLKNITEKQLCLQTA